MIRIAQVVGYMNGAGVEAVVMNYYRHIDRTKIQFDFIVSEGSKLIPKEEIESLGGRVFMVPSYKNILSYRKRLKELFESERWSIVHCHNNTLSVFPLQIAAEVGIPVRISHSHSTAGKGEHIRNAVKALLRTQSNRYPTHRFACSEYAGRWLFKNREFEIVYNAIELEEFRFDADVRKKVRKELCLRDDQYVIGHVGRFMTQKNHEFLIKIFDELSRDCDDVVLALAGDGELRRSVEKEVRSRGLDNKVLFLGQRGDIASVYNAFDIFVLPSLYEGLCVVGIEAQRSGLMCLFSDSITREVDISGNCFFIPIDEISPWIERILNCKANQANRFVSDDEASFKNYDINVQGAWLTNKYMNMYEEAVNK